jgi:D(-)-tartrate dehydratase
MGGFCISCRRETLCRLLLPNNIIGQIKYFTALVSAHPSDPDQPLRQQLYLRALGTIPSDEILKAYPVYHSPTVEETTTTPQDTSRAHTLREGFKDPMRIVDLREVTAPIASPIANAYIDFSKMTCSLVALVTDVVRDGRTVIGYGFNSNGRYGQGGLIRERFAPRVLEAEPRTLLNDAGDNLDPDQIWQTLMRNEKPGGHGERSVAVGTIDMAVWDAVAKIAGKPLFHLLAERYGAEANPRVFVYAAGGYYYPGKNLEALRSEMRSYLDRGYTVVKMKIGGAAIAEDRQRIEAVLAEIGGQAQLAVDANGRFDLETAIAYAKMLRQYPLFWYEEAGDPLDYALQAALAEFYPGPMATGENLFSHQDARNLLRYGGMRPDRDWLQFDCALSYGLCEYLRTLEVLKTAGWSRQRCIPHGGHQMSLNIAAGLGLGGNESYPDLFQPYGGFPDGVRVDNGHIVMPDLPGIGFEGKADLIRVMRRLAE